jgi:hypothetical protein
MPHPRCADARSKDQDDGSGEGGVTDGSIHKARPSNQANKEISMKLYWRGYIDITDVDLRTLVKIAYSMSQPHGLGAIHYKPGELADEQLDKIMEQAAQCNGALRIDYLKGRSMKFNVYVDEDTQRRYFNLDWYDHGRLATAELLRDAKVPNIEDKLKRAADEKDEPEAERRVRQESSDGADHAS